MGTIINSLGYSAGVVDGNASVQGAAEALSKNPSDPGLKAAYDAAYANAVAAETALIPGVGAVFASSAIKMDLQSISINGANPSNLISLASNIAILASQGIALSAALAGGGEVAVTVGATTFALSELVVQVGPRCAPAVQTAGLSGILCLRHNMLPRRVYASQTESPAGGTAGDSGRAA